MPNGFYIDCHRMTVPENILLQKKHWEWESKGKGGGREGGDLLDQCQSASYSCSSVIVLPYRETNAFGKVCSVVAEVLITARIS